MYPIKAIQILAGVALGAGLIGFLLVGIALGMTWRADVPMAVTAHPLFLAGAKCLSGAAVCGLLLVVTRSAARR